MKSYPTDRIRNVAFVGHGGAGKTTLAEALLVRAGAVPRAGKVDDGSSVLDTEPESTKRHMSLSLTLAPFEWKADDGNTYKVNLLDTPGYLDFEGEVDAALSVADLAVFVVSAVEGVEVQTERLWRKVAALGLRVRGGCCYHGVSLNVDMELAPFSAINPCGYPGLKVTQLRDLGVADGWEAAGEKLLAQLKRQIEL